MTCNNMRRARSDECATVDMFPAIIGYADKYEAPMVKDRIKLLLVVGDKRWQTPWVSFCITAYLEDLLLARMFIANFGDDVIKPLPGRNMPTHRTRTR